jgi:hypothetical protein
MTYRSFRFGRSRAALLEVSAPLFAMVPAFVLALAMHRVVPSGIALVVAILSSATVFAYQHAIVCVGADGVRTRRRVMGRWRYVPYRAIIEVAFDRKNLVLRLADGEVAWHHHDAGGTTKIDADWLTLARRVWTGWSESHANEVSAAITVLERGDRTAQVWLDELRKMATASYRVASLTDDVLWRVVEDGDAVESSRIGAAILLRRTLDHDARVRVARIADCCVSEELHETLLLVAHTPDHAFEDVIGATAARARSGARPLRR